MRWLQDRYNLLFLSILVIGVLVRLYGFSNPIADWHSWRQADTSSVSRIFSEKGFDVLHPRFHDLSNVPSGFDNPNGYRYVEFPFYNILQAGFYSIFHGFTLEEWGRIVTILAGVFSVIFLYGLLLRHTERSVALWSTFFFAVLPYNIFYGRVVLPDPLMVTFTLGGIYFFDWKIRDILSFRLHARAGELKKIFFFLFTALLLAIALLLKPFAVFFFLPLVALLYLELGWKCFFQWRVYVFGAIVILPLLWWRWWMLQYPEGIPVNDWLLNGGNIRFKGAFFYWVFADHIGKQILGYVGYGLVMLGVLIALSGQMIREKKDRVFFAAFLFSTLSYLFVVARGNVQHDYYQIPIVPSISLFLGFGAAFLWRPLREFSRAVSIPVMICTVSLMLFFSWYHIREFFNINNPNIVVAGKVVDALLPKDAKVITFYGGDTSFLYQTKRNGWASLQKSMPEMITLGAEYVAIVNPTEEDFEGFGKNYQIVASDQKYLILKLQ